MTMLDGKLDRTGGTITGTLTSNGRIILKSFLQFNQYNADAEYLLGMTDNNGILRWYNGSSWNTLLHSGNVGEYALKTDGSNAMTGDLQLLTMGSGSVNVAVTEGLFIYRGPSSGGTDVGLPDNYINVFNVGGTNAYSNLQLAWMRDYLNPTLYARIGESSAYSDWKVIAFTDSDITGNAATATKVSNVLKFGSKTFDGSSEQTITATDLGVTSDTVATWGFTKNAGTVTSIATGTGLTGGTITGTGTISLDSTYQTYCTNGNAA